MAEETWCYVANTATGGYEMRCDRCGSKYEPVMPMPIWAFSAIIGGFIEEHRKCEAHNDGVARGS